MAANAERARQFFDHLASAEDWLLVVLAQHGRDVPRPPAFHGRCLEPAFLEAVATGQWTQDDAGLLCRVLRRVEASELPRVAWRHRRGLKRALGAAAVSMLTESVASSAWQRRRPDLACAWTRTLGPMPTV